MIGTKAETRLAASRAGSSAEAGRDRLRDPASSGTISCNLSKSDGSKKRSTCGKRSRSFSCCSCDHAAGEHERHLRLLALEPGEVVQLAGNFILGRLAHDARIQHDDVGVILLLGWTVSNFKQHSRDLGAVGFIHLAADGPDEKVLAVGRQAPWRGRGMEGQARFGHCHGRNLGITDGGRSAGKGATKEAGAKSRNAKVYALLNCSCI